MKLMIVDDDDQIRDGMTFGIQWKNFDIGEVKGFKNGKDALLCLEQEYFDIIISDISMPVMSGVELMKRVREKHSEISFILISGYKEFEYAQAGIRYGADGYILKPIHLNELIELITKVVKKIEQRKEDTENRTVVSEMGKNQIIRQIIQNKIVNQEEIRRFLIDKNGFERIHVLLGVVIDDDDRTYGMESDEAIKAIFMKKITEFLAGYTYAVFSMDGNEQFLLINVVDSALRVFLLQQQIGRMLKDINREINAGSFSAGVSEIGYLSDIPQIYENAKSVLEYRFFQGKGACLFYKDCKEKENVFQAEEWNEKIFSVIENGDEEELKNKINECKKALNGNKKEFIQEYIFQNMVHICTAQKDKKLENQIKREVFDSETYEETIVVWLDFLNKVMEKRKELEKYSNDILMALEYMRSHYMDKISLEQMAEYLEISQGHFSRMFKQQVGIPFIKYLNQYRVDKAEELLKNTNLKVYEVAEQVGIPDYIYFTQVFRNLTGKSPTDVR